MSSKKKKPKGLMSIRDHLKNLIGKPDDVLLQQCIDALSSHISNQTPIYRPPRMPNWMM